MSKLECLLLSPFVECNLIKQKLGKDKVGEYKVKSERITIKMKEYVMEINFRWLNLTHNQNWSN